MKPHRNPDRPRSGCQWGRLRREHALCRRMLNALDLVACVQHVDGCRLCREEIAKRKGLGWRLAKRLIREHGRRAIEAAPMT